MVSEVYKKKERETKRTVVGMFVVSALCVSIGAVLYYFTKVDRSAVFTAFAIAMMALILAVFEEFELTRTLLNECEDDTEKTVKELNYQKEGK